MTAPKNRHERRKAKAKAKPHKKMWFAQFVKNLNGEWFWFEAPDERFVEPSADTVIHGPFATEAECNEHHRVTQLGAQCKVIEAGEWPKEWSTPQ